MAAATAKKPKAKQVEMFPDLDEKKDADLIEAAEAWIEHAAARKKLLADDAEKERDLRKRMVDLAKPRKLMTFKIGDVRVNLEDVTKAKMRVEKSTGKDDDEGDDNDD